jgi:hypothetical protein
MLCARSISPSLVTQLLSSLPAGRLSTSWLATTLRTRLSLMLMCVMDMWVSCTGGVPHLAWDEPRCGWMEKGTTGHCCPEIGMIPQTRRCKSKAPDVSVSLTDA